MQYQQTPLHCAASSGYTDSVMQLVDRGADISVKNKVSLVMNNVFNKNYFI